MCQSCGLDSAPTFDHYLPQSLFPEFAVMPANLVPSCGTCNTIKDNGVLDENGNRKFIHYYFDNLPDTQFLHLDLIYRNEVPTVSFKLLNNTSINPDLFDLIKNHFTHLNLLNRYKEKFPNIHSRAVSRIKNARTLKRNPRSIKRFLEDEAISIKQINGINFWEAIIYDELSKSSQFINQF